MAKCADFRTQSSAVDTPGAGVVSYYVNSSGILRFVDADGVDKVASTFQPTVLANAQITATGDSFSPTNTVAIATGHVYGTTGTYKYPTFLGEPNVWFPFIGPSGQLYAVPAYLRS